LLLGTAGLIIGLVVLDDNDDSKDDDDSNNYETEFSFSAAVIINGDYTYTTSASGESMTTSCKTITDAIGESLTDPWDTVSITSVDMEASNVDLLINCLATSDKIASTGYNTISFMGWTSLDGSLDSATLQLLADAAPNASSFTYGNPNFASASTTETTSDLQYQLVAFSTLMLNASSKMTSVNI